MILDIYETYNADQHCSQRWKRWEHHRNTISAILAAKVFARGSLQHAAVLGAGRCEDLDLKFLLKRVDTLTLMDYDTGSMERALERQQLTSQERQQIHLQGGLEFTGFYQEAFLRHIEGQMKEKRPAEQILAQIRQQLAEADPEWIHQLEQPAYDLVISGAVHSQLIVPYAELAAANPDYTSALMGEAASMADRLAEIYNRCLTKLVAEDGWLFAYCDSAELSDRSGLLAYEEIIGGLLAQEEYAQIDELFLQGGGVAGARQGYQDLRCWAQAYEPYEKYWIWPFRENKKYYVRSLCAKKTPQEQPSFRDLKSK
ncbi:hypothetical protein Ami103574_14205 [Aminipila butyrica]|uniref:Uncharacterized protein n=1 Tax=Aminipila butyrica TaxID=433296 RepID=A0A858BWA8_9FIRM|nr:hypothetical protein [Aminipila butyrica]QIB70371.1 hypothetical protein Ami103574_14205 [Aminipila butyrica]